MAEDPIPNELDNALSQLIPAVMACGDPQSPDYLDLAVFETLVETAPTWRGSAAGGGGRGRLSVRVAGQVEVAFRHCMHEAAMAVTVRDEGGGGGGGGRAMRTRGKKGKSSRSGGGGGSGDLFSEVSLLAAAVIDCGIEAKGQKRGHSFILAVLYYTIRIPSKAS